jgi:host factor-I protein
MIWTYSREVHFTIPRFQDAESGAAAVPPRPMEACPTPAGLLRIRAEKTRTQPLRSGWLKFHQTWKEPHVESPNRRLIRPPLADAKDKRAPVSRAAFQKQSPPDTTNAENFYYVKQMQSKTPMIIVLQDGEQIHGVIEWYDKTCLKVNREGDPNLLVYKSYIKYMYKA